MAISVAFFTDINETQLKLAYDDGRDDRFTDKIGRFYDEMIAQPFVPTDFLNVAGRLTEAKLIAVGILKGAVSKTNLAITATDGTYAYNLDADLLRFIGAGDAGRDIEDDTGVIRTLTAGNVTTLKDDYETRWESNQVSKVAETTALNAAISVAALDVLLAASAFGTLGPVYS